MAQRELIREVLDSNVVWMCAQCLQCKERCPRDVTPYDIIMSLQNQAVREGLHYPEGLSKMLGSMKSLGSIQPPQEVVDREFDSFDREELELPEMSKPGDLVKFVKALEMVMGGGSDA
jgi:heterodisulfide reductase subunit C